MYKLYEKGYKLKDDEYLLKIRINNDKSQTGFLTKLTQKGELPIAFDEWTLDRYYRKTEAKPHVIYIFKEEFREGWKIIDWRFGMSQNWATMMHPAGFTVEIYLDQLLTLIKEIKVEKGELIGEFKWEKKKLIHRNTILW